jgi:hypothetical protein
VDNNIIIKENYGKSSAADFIAKGHCKALFRGKENIEKDISNIKASLGKNLIRVFDIVLYNEIEIKGTVLIEDWDKEIITYSNLPQFMVQFQKEAAIHFSKIEWKNVDFMRTEIEKGIIINPKINYAYHEDGFTFGEIEGDLLFKVYNPKPEINPIIPEVIPVQVLNTKTIIRNTFEPLLPSGLSSADLPMMQSAGCFWSILRLIFLLLLASLLIKGCSQFSSKVWNQDRDNIIKNDSTLRIPDGDEKEFKDGNKKFTIDLDTTIAVPPGTYKLFIKDYGSKVDHDKINLFLNGQMYKRNMEIYRKQTEIPLTNLKYGENYLDFAVVSQGLEGNCTAKIILINADDSNFAAKLKINNVVNHISRLKIIQR